MSSVISDSDEGSSSEDCTEQPAKKRRMNKTPISLLTELCVQKVSKAVNYSEISTNNNVFIILLLRKLGSQYLRI